MILEFFEYLTDAFIFFSSELINKISDPFFDSFKFSQFFNLILIFLIPSLYFRKCEFFQGAEYSHLFPFLITDSADAETVGVLFFFDILNGHVEFTKFLKFFRVELYLIFDDAYIGEMCVILALYCAYFIFNGLELFFQLIFLSLENLVVSFKLFFELFSSNKGKVEILLEREFVFDILSFFVDLFFIFYYFLQFSFYLTFLLCFFVVDFQSFFIGLFDLGKLFHIDGYSFFINILQNLFLCMYIRDKFILLLLKFLLFLFKLFVRFFIFLKFLNLRMNISQFRLKYSFRFDQFKFCCLKLIDSSRFFCEFVRRLFQLNFLICIFIVELKFLIDIDIFSNFAEITFRVYDLSFRCDAVQVKFF